MIKIRKLRSMIVGMFLITVLHCAYGQSQADLGKIAASKGESSPLTYTTSNKEIPLIKPGNFYNEKECTVRKGLPNFFSKIREGQEIMVAFVGGSITQGEYCYRLQATYYMENTFSDVRFKWINAGISGTGTDLGAFRIREQVLQYKPDIIFLEFAVNGGYSDGMEGMIRKVIKENPYTDICLIYSVCPNQIATYQKGDVPQVIKDLEKIAAHYQLPSIHLCMEAVELEKAEKLLWKGTKEAAAGRILFSNDGIHPVIGGGNLYASAIARGLEKIRKGDISLQAHILPEPLIGLKWETAEMYMPSQIASFDKSWKEFCTSENPSLKKFSCWFDTVMTSGKEGASFSFDFEGDMIGLFDIGGPEVGQVEILVDGKSVLLKEINTKGFRFYEANDHIGNSALNRFNSWCNNRYRGQYDVIKLDRGVHQITVRIFSQKADKKRILGDKLQEDITAHPEKYNQSVIYLGRILLRGEPVPCSPMRRCVN